MKPRKLKILAMFFGLILSSCGSAGGDSGHVHTYKSQWSSDETYHWHDSSCGHDVVSEKAEHTFGNLIIDTPATETTDGSGHYICTVCYYQKNVTIDKQHAHHFSTTWTYDATYHWHACDGCSETRDKAAHDFGIWVIDVEPTETSAGSKHRGCTVCPYVERVTIDPLDHEHEYSPNWSYNSYSHWHECSCGDKKDEGYHSFNGWVIDKPATATETGHQYRACTVCPYTEEQTIEPTGAVYATGVTISPKTATVEAGKDLELTALLSPEGSQPYGRLAWDVNDYTSAYVYDDGPQSVTARFSAYVSVAVETDVTITLTYWSQEGQVTDTAVITIVPAEDPGPGPVIPDDQDPNPENDTVNHIRFGLNEDEQSYGVWGLWDEIEEIIIPTKYKELPVTFVGELFIGSWRVDSEGTQYNLVEKLKKVTIPVTILGIHEDAWVFAEKVEVTYLGTKEQLVSISDGFIPDGATCSDGVLSDNWEGPAIEEYETIEYNGFKISRLDKKISFKGYYGNEKEISIPATYNGYPVTSASLTSPTTDPITIETIHANSLYGVGIDSSYVKGVTKIYYGYNTTYAGNHLEECMFEFDSDSRFKIDDNGFIIRKNDPSTIINSNGNVSGPITIPEGVKTINTYAFFKKNISSVTFPNTLETIGYGAFLGTSLTSVTIPNSVETIGSSAFSGCAGLKSVILSNKLEQLDEFLFENCVSLTSIEIPDSVTSIRYAVFDGCTSLSSIVFPNSVTKMETCFYKCSNLKSVTLSDGIKILDASMFYGCTKLETVHLPKNLEEIRSCAFENCTSLVSIDLPSTLLFIGGGAFLNCSSLSDITLPNGLLAIGEGAFKGCTSLGVLSIPDSVEEFGAGALYSVSPNAFSNSDRYINDNGVLYNKSKTWLYHYDFNKEDEIFEIPNTVEVIDGGAFVGRVGNTVAKLKSVVIPKSLKYVLNTTLPTTTFYEYLYGFSDFNKLTVFYKGTSDEWNQITIYGDGNSLSTADICFYSNSQPGDTTKSYWHYVDGVPTKW